MHAKSHEGIKEHKCEYCNKFFSSNSVMKKHVMRMHTHRGIKNVTCETCGKAFFDLSQMNVHIKSVHKGIRSEPCMFCGKTFGVKEALKKHIRYIHEGKQNHLVTKFLGNTNFGVKKLHKFYIHLKKEGIIKNNMKIWAWYILNTHTI